MMPKQLLRVGMSITKNTLKMMANADNAVQHMFRLFCSAP